MSEFEVKRIELMERLSWMRIVRFFASVIVLAIYLTIYGMKVFIFPVVPFVLCCFAEAILNQPYPFIVNKAKDLYKLAFFHLFMDLVLISGMIHYVGGIEISFFNAIYPLVIISAAIVLSRKATFQIATLASFFFAGMVGFEYFNFIPHIPLLGIKYQGHYQVGLVAANILFFYFVAFVATYSQSIVDEKNRRIKQQRDYAESLLGLMTDSLVTMDLNGTIRSVNKAAIRSLKHEKEELIGQSFILKLCPEERREQFRNILVNFRNAGELVNFEMDLLTKEGKIAPVRLNASILNDERAGNSGILMIFHDIIPERQTERIRSIFLSNFSRELNDPLSVIKGFAKILLEKREITESERAEYLQIMSDEADRLERIMTDLDELAKLEVGWLKIKREKGQLLDIIRNVADNYGGEAKKKKLLFHINLPENMTPIYFDAENIKRALAHLVENALKFTPVGEVSIEAEEEEDKVLVSVSDTGVVMPESELKRIFEQFYLDKEKRPTIGKMNIRIPIVKHIIEAHGGSIWARSQVEEGTKFTFTLPKIAQQI